MGAPCRILRDDLFQYDSFQSPWTRKLHDRNVEPDVISKPDYDSVSFLHLWTNVYRWVFWSNHNYGLNWIQPAQDQN